MFKAIGTFIHRTPWWAMILLGFSTLAFLVIFATPFQLLRLSESGATPEQRRLIKKEIDSAFLDSGLGVAEGVVAGMRKRSVDPARKAELDQAMEEIARARTEIFNAKKDGTNAAKEAAASEATQEAVNNAMESVRTAAEGVIEGAQERREAIEEARREIEASLKTAGVTGPEAFKAIDEQLAAAKAQEIAAQKALADLNKTFTQNHIKLNAGGIGVKMTDSNTDKDGNVNKSKTKLSAKPGDKPSIKFDGDIAGKHVKGSIDLNDGARKTINIDGVDVIDIQVRPTPPPPPLSPEVRNNIRDTVAASTKRIGIGSVLILIFIPLFIMTMVAKYFIDRSRRATAYAESQTREAEFQSANRQIVEARLQALQAQVEPHFLYNTLANVQALTETDPPQANKMVGHLIQYLRAALPKMRETTSTVGQEVELVRAYLNILKMRMGERLAFDITIPTELESLPFPPLMLPSLVENAIKHGLEPQREGGRIDVSAEKIGEGANANIRLIVKDTGRGLDNMPTQSGSGVGLANIRERLHALFGDQARLTLESNVPNGVVATIDVPAVTLPPFSASGDPRLPFSRSLFGSAPRKFAEPAPAGFAARTWWIARKTHNLWLRILTAIFIGVVVLLGVFLVISLLSVITGIMPIQFYNHELSGVEGMAFGSVALLAVFCLLILVAIVLAVLAYGLGVLFAVLLVGIPIIIIISLFPALAPFILFGGLIWWLVKRNNKKKLVKTVEPPTERPVD